MSPGTPPHRSPRNQWELSIAGGKQAQLLRACVLSGSGQGKSMSLGTQPPALEVNKDSASAVPSAEIPPVLMGWGEYTQPIPCRGPLSKVT